MYSHMLHRVLCCMRGFAVAVLDVLRPMQRLRTVEPCMMLCRLLCALLLPSGKASTAPVPDQLLRPMMARVILLPLSCFCC